MPAVPHYVPPPIPRVQTSLQPHKRRRTLVPFNVYRFVGEGAEIARSFLLPQAVDRITQAGWILQKCIALYIAGGIHYLYSLLNLTTEADQQLLALATKSGILYDRPSE